MVTTVSVGSVAPFRVAVTAKVRAAPPSLRLWGLTLSSMSAGASSVMVVVTDEVPSLGAGPPPPAGLDTETVKVSSGSSVESAVVCTVRGLRPRSRPS